MLQYLVVELVTFDKFGYHNPNVVSQSNLSLLPLRTLDRLLHYQLVKLTSLFGLAAAAAREASESAGVFPEAPKAVKRLIESRTTRGHFGLVFQFIAPGRPESHGAVQ